MPRRRREVKVTLEAAGEREGEKEEEVTGQLTVDLETEREGERAWEARVVKASSFQSFRTALFNPLSPTTAPPPPPFLLLLLILFFLWLRLSTVPLHFRVLCVKTPVGAPEDREGER